jgi:hypothetical protein
VSLYIAIALSAAAFNIGRARDAEGREIIPVNECSPGIIRSVVLTFKFILDYTNIGVNLITDSPTL